MYQILIKMTHWLERCQILRVLKESFIMVVPVLLTGACSLIFTGSPVAGFQKFISEFCGGIIMTTLTGIYEATYGFLALYLVVAISQNYSACFNRKNYYLRNINMVLCVICLSASLGIGRNGVTQSAFGPTGVFTAMLVGIIVTKLFYEIYGLCCRIHNRGRSYDEMDSRYIALAIIPFALLSTIFIFCNIMIYLIFDVSGLHELFSDVVSMGFGRMGNNLGSGILLALIEGVFWFLGIHGSNAMEQVVQNTFVIEQAEGTMLVTKSFIDNFTLMGGCGTTICLLLALLIVSRKKKNRNLAYMSIPLVAFNINEPLVFGLPIVLNPLLFLPFLIVPVMSLVIAYAAVLSGFMPMCINEVQWTTPVLISGYLATGSIRGSIVQLCCILLGVSIYAPFVKMMEQLSDEQEMEYLIHMEECFKEDVRLGKSPTILLQANGMGHVANAMVEKIRDDIEHHRIPMYYQPQVTGNGELFGAEALLRFDFCGHKVYPPLLIWLAREEGLLGALSLEIVEQVCKDTKAILSKNGKNILVSVNITAEELEDTDFIRTVIDLIHDYQLYEQICLEVTEETPMDAFPHIKDNIQLLNEYDIELAIDDFSMGHTSLKYLQDNYFSHVKLDGELVKGMLENQRSKEIISSIVSLGNNLGFHVIAEHVDSEEKKEELIRLGCSYMQGYLFSQALDAEKFIEFCLEK